MIDNTRTIPAHAGNDFLKSNPPTSTNNPSVDFTNTERLLKGILAELRKDTPKQRCVINVQGIVANNGFMGCSSTKAATITFLNQGNPVKSLYTIIVNGSDSIIGVSINEPIMTAGLNYNNGLHILGQTNVNYLIIPNVEIQNLSIIIDSAVVDILPINNAPVAAVGCVWVYGWTLPEYENITE